jgi:nucleotide-binding universal stress UspA family protein
MIHRILVAVHDSTSAIHAARVAAELAAATGADLRAVSVFQDGRLTGLVAHVVGGQQAVEAARRGSVSAVLGHAAAIAARAGVGAGRVELVERDGEPGPEIVAETLSWGADLVVLGRSRPAARGGRDGAGAHVVEFADVPVLIVP